MDLDKLTTWKLVTISEFLMVALFFYWILSQLALHLFEPFGMRHRKESGASQHLL